MEELFFGDRGAILEGISEFKDGHCVMCGTGTLETLPSGIVACDTCDFSD